MKDAMESAARRGCAPNLDEASRKEEVRAKKFERLRSTASKSSLI
jgi:hypothetical protein